MSPALALEGLVQAEAKPCGEPLSKVSNGFRPNVEGIFHNLDAAIYHAAPGASNSMLKHIDPPAMLPIYLTQPRKVTPAMILGTLTHARILEPSKPLTRVIVPPEEYPAPADCSLVKQKKVSVGDPVAWSWNANYCKAWRQNQEAAGRIVITQTEYDALEGMTESVLKHSVCREIFSRGESEVSVFKNYTLGNTVLRKCRIDFLPIGNCIPDLKTCQDASKSAFSKTMHDEGYHTQLSYYMDAYNDCLERNERETALLIAVEKTPPYLVAVYQLDTPTIQNGRGKWIERIQTYMECVERNEWPGYPEAIQTISLPQWALRKPFRWSSG